MGIREIEGFLCFMGPFVLGNRASRVKRRLILREKDKVDQKKGEDREEQSSYRSLPQAVRQQ